MTQETQAAHSPNAFARIARGALWLLFAMLLLVPKLIALRRRERPWNVFRAIVAALGVILILESLLTRAETAFAVLGAALVLLGLFVPPEPEPVVR